jgi:hypothetical protein
MRTQAKHCTRKELAYLSHWRRNGYLITIDEPIPLSTLTPPSLATRRPIVDALVGGLLVVVCLTAAGAWLGKAAGIY